MRGAPKFRGDANRLSFEEMQALRESIGGSYSFRGRFPETPNRSQTLVRVKAHSTLARWQPVCIDAPLFAPTSNSLTPGLIQATAFNSIAFSVVRPWVVCAEPIPSGKIGWAVIRGITPCMIFVADNSAPKFGAHITSNERLEIGNGGPGRILYVRAGTDLQPAVIDLNQVAPRFMTGTTVGSIAGGAVGSVSVTSFGTFSARHLGTVTIATSKTVGITWDDSRSEYVVTMEFC